MKPERNGDGGDVAYHLRDKLASIAQVGSLLLIMFVLALAFTGCAEGGAVIVGDYATVYQANEVGQVATAAPSEQGDEAWAFIYGAIYGAFVIVVLIFMGFMLGIGRSK